MSMLMHLWRSQRTCAVAHADAYKYLDEACSWSQHADAFKHLATVGIELGGALKNVLAIACGISDGLGYGHNARAALITRGLTEITRLAVALGAHPLTMGGLAGMGDLVLTCTGHLALPHVSVAACA